VGRDCRDQDCDSTACQWLDLGRRMMVQVG
jgi:hypothetical protein